MEKIGLFIFLSLFGAAIGIGLKALINKRKNESEK